MHSTNESVESVRKRVHDLIQDAIASGQPLKLIRRKLREMGVRFNYSCTPAGQRERERRLRQHSLCATGCGQHANWRMNPMCFDCRAKQWS